MDRTPDERDFALIARNPFSFSVLAKILGGPCRIVLTDHENMILCHSADPYPVWIWTPDEIQASEQEKIWSILREYAFLDKPCTYNVKYGLADLLRKRAAEEGLSARIRTNMLAYENPHPVKPGAPAEGEMRKGTVKDTDLLTALRKAFHEELDLDRTTDAEYRSKSVRDLAGGSVYFWQVGEQTAGCCLLKTEGRSGHISLVYTVPEFRRRHIAGNLVYRVSCESMKRGKIPALYTDADYAPSNACYRQIGFEERESLCSLEISPV